MVVTADSQKIFKKKRRYKSKTVSHSPIKRKEYFKSRSLSVSRKPVPLYLIPFISGLFLFSLYINISDSYWKVKEPRFSLNELSLPDEEEIIINKQETLKASVTFPALYDHNTNETESKPFFTMEYRLREDDRYSIIAEKFNISLDSLISVNGIDSSESPIPGNTILIPNISGIYYTVKKGDTLTSISKKFNLDLENILIVNDMYSSMIHIDEKLFLPDVRLNSQDIDRILGHKFLIPSSGSVKNNYGSYLDPGTGLKNYNYGIDIINGKGTAVYAAKDGVVNNTSYNSYYGRVILLNHSSSFQSMYSCLDSIAVEPGQKVLRGQLLGYIGNSGFKSNEHLQFSIFKNKEDVDTLEYIF